MFDPSKGADGGVDLLAVAKNDTYGRNPENPLVSGSNIANELKHIPNNNNYTLTGK